MIQETTPLVSIILPTYNRLNLLKKALKSVINQTYKNVEILIGDNCSTDGTEEYCIELAQKDNRIKYHKNDTNIGPFLNSNEIIKRVKGDYFIFLNDDDWLDSDYIEQSMTFLLNNPEYNFVSPSTILYKDEYTREKKCHIPILNQEDPVERIIEFVRTYWVTDVVTGVFKTEILNNMLNIDHFCFLSRLPEDVIFMLKYLASGKAMILSNTHYNKLNNGITRKLEETPKQLYYTEGYKYKNLTLRTFLDAVNFNITKAINEDKIFAYYLTKDEIKQVCIRLHKTLILDICYSKYKQNKKEVKQYIKRHPLFFLRKEFYKKIKKYKITKAIYRKKETTHKKIIMEINNG